MKKLLAAQSQVRLFNAGDSTAAGEDEIDPRPEIVCYRSQTFAMVRHFFELSSQVGRLPSLLGREFFRARVSHRTIPSFEDQVVFVRDVEMCFARLSDQHAEMITLIGLYSFSREEVAQMLRASKTWVNNHVAEALDALSEIFLYAGLLRADRPDRRQRQVSGRSLPPDLDAAYGAQLARSPALSARPSSAHRYQRVPA